MHIRMPSRLWLKLLLLAGMAAFLYIWILNSWGCVFRRLTGIPCVACGMNRAWHAVLRLDFRAAFRYHPMFWSVPVFALYGIFDFRLFRNKKIDDWLLGLLLAALFGSYLIRLVVYFSGGVAF